MRLDAPVLPLAHLTGLAVAAVGSAWLAVLGLSHSDLTAIIVALISAAGVVIASHNGRRIRRLEHQVRGRRVVVIRHQGVHGPDGGAYDEDEDETTERDW